MEVRFNVVQTEFKGVYHRFENVNKRFSQIQWTMDIGFTVLAILMAVFNFF